MVDGLAANIDSAPTILDLAGVPPLSSALGHSLVPMNRGDVRAVNQCVYAKDGLANRRRSVHSENHLLIKHLG